MPPHALTGDVFAIAPPGKVTLGLGELWHSRELVWYLAWRTIKVRYKQSFLGIGWAVIQPFLTMVIFSVIFVHVGRLKTNGVPAPIFYYSALVPWYFFSTTVAQTSQSLVSNIPLIQKVYFARLALPAASVVSSLVDFVIAFTVLIGMMAYYGIGGNGVALGTLPLFLLLAAVAALGIGTALASLNVRYRDVQYAVPFVLQIWLLITVAVPPSSFSGPWRTVYGLNPMVGVVTGFRWALLPHADPPGRIVVASIAVSAAALIAGVWYFRKTERVIADVG
jgi:lipopolysaccharide transport system permease protein